MKKLLFAMMSCMLIVLASCSGSDPKAINEKLEKDANVELSQSDYKVMIEYMDGAMDEAAKITDINEFEKLDAQFPYSQNFMGALFGASVSNKLDEANTKAYDALTDKLAKIQQDIMQRTLEQMNAQGAFDAVDDSMFEPEPDFEGEE